MTGWKLDLTVEERRALLLFIQAAQHKPKGHKFVI
jgi:hypothetical protein